MKPELNREYPGPDETELFEEMVKLVGERMKPQQGRIRRGQHAKATGCVRGVFTIRDDVADELRYGVFHKPSRAFQAVVRFSNSSETIDPDDRVAARGMAIKLLDVQGAPAIPGTVQCCQDFLTVNLPVFPFATPAEYVKFFDIRALPVVGDPLAAAWFALFHPLHAESVIEIAAERVPSPLLAYWSGSPYWLGPPGTIGGRAVKYSLVPCFEGMSPPDQPDSRPDDYLSQALARHMRTKEAIFEFRVQPQSDPETMPVEDTSVEWDEEVSKPIPVATLVIGVQEIDSTAGRAFAEECEAMVFSPWNALAEHRPMGGINRMRKTVYLASQAKRVAESQM